jgi:hypothetical protein
MADAKNDPVSGRLVGRRIHLDRTDDNKNDSLVRDKPETRNSSKQLDDNGYVKKSPCCSNFFPTT